jgi:plasmid stabilization system protein ParE
VPRVVFAPAAVRGLERCGIFLVDKHPAAARRAGQVIAWSLATLETAPGAGRPLLESPELREWVIPFGDAGYAALYRFDAAADVVVVLAFRHQREAGY